MRKTAYLALSFLLAPLCVAQEVSSTSDRWWSYMAQYEGKPGSTRVDLGAKDNAPMPALAWLVIAGLRYDDKAGSGLPSPSMVDRLNGMSDRLVASILKGRSGRYVGTFTHDGEQLHYVYVSHTVGAEEQFAAALSAACSTCKPSYKARHDPEWRAYLEFLYPNQATLDFYRLDPSKGRL